MGNSIWDILFEFSEFLNGKLKKNWHVASKLENKLQILFALKASIVQRISILYYFIIAVLNQCFVRLFLLILGPIMLVVAIVACT